MERCGCATIAHSALSPLASPLPGSPETRDSTDLASHPACPAPNHPTRHPQLRLYRAGNLNFSPLTRSGSPQYMSLFLASLSLFEAFTYVARCTRRSNNSRYAKLYPLRYPLSKSLNKVARVPGTSRVFLPEGVESIFVYAWRRVPHVTNGKFTSEFIHFFVRINGVLLASFIKDRRLRSNRALGLRRRSTYRACLRLICSIELYRNADRDRAKIALRSARVSISCHCASR